MYIADLVGCTVNDGGREIGRIQDVQFGAGEAPLLVIAAEGEKQYLVPFAAEFLKSVDLERKQVSMELPAGLLELDAPLTEQEKERQKRSSRE